MSKPHLAALAIAALAIVPPAGQAGVGVIQPLSTSTATNGGAATINARFLSTATGQALPYVEQFYLGPDDCVRIDLTAQSADLEAVLISPSGAVWRNDDRGGAPKKRRFPLIKANADVGGWYTLEFSTFNGAGPSANFTFKFGRYAEGNTNCATLTPVERMAADADTVK